MTESTTTVVEDETARPVRSWIGLGLGPVLAVASYLLLGQDSALSAPGRSVAAVAVLMAVWWMTEALPLAATALVPIVALPLLDVYAEVASQAEADGKSAATEVMKAVTGPYASSIVFLFMGGFMMAIAMQKWNLHKRLALLTMRLVGTQPNRLLLGMMIATAFLSMWMSNTATTLMMLPIGISMLALMGDADSADRRRFGVSLMLAIAYAASIGGLGTIIGSPPNGILVKTMAEPANGGTEISFGQWMTIGVPLVVVFLAIAWLVLSRVVFRNQLPRISGGREEIQRQLDDLGPMSRGEWTVLVVFSLTALLWITRTPLTNWDALTSAVPLVSHLNDTVIVIAACLVLFIIPVSRTAQALDWKSVQTGVPWGVLLLFGGGLSLAGAIGASGLSEYIGEKMSGLQGLPIVLLVAVVAVIVLLLTELTSNTATAATFVPIIAAVGGGLAIDDGALLLAMPVALAATCAFMLPVGTPPNAIVFATGRVRIGQMIRGGIVLNVIGVALITVAMFTVGSWALGG